MIGRDPRCHCPGGTGALQPVCQCRRGCPWLQTMVVQMTPWPMFVRVLIVDLVAIVVFAAIGRGTHDSGSALMGTLTVAAPFLIGYAVSAIATGLPRAPYSLMRVLLAWAPGIAFGMVLRRLVFDRGTATPFVIVAFLTTALLLVGWRLARHLIVRRSSRQGR